MIAAGRLTREGLMVAADRPLLHDLAGRTQTGNETLAHVDRLAGALVRRELTGARIGLWFRNGIPAIEAFAALEWVGAGRVAVDPNAPESEARAIFAAAGVGAVLADEPRAALLGPPALQHDHSGRLADVPIWPALQVQDRELAVLYPRAVQQGTLFSVPMSYANWDATVRANIGLYRSGRYGAWDETHACFLDAQQVMHGTGFLGTFPFLAMGRPQVVASDFDIEAIVEAIAHHRVTSTMLVPVMLKRLTGAAETAPARLSSLRNVLYGGGAVPLEDLRRSVRALGPILCQLYGRFEGGWPITILDADDHAAILAGDDDRGRSCGRPIDAVEVKLRPLGKEGTHRGELCVRGPMVVEDYADADGWCSLGDVMTVDRGGYFSFKGRLDRMINTGYHIYPSEIEAAIVSLGLVEAVRVVGEANPEWGQTVVAYLVIDPGGAGAGDVVDRIRKELSARLAKYKVPRIFRVLEKLPDVDEPV